MITTDIRVGEWRYYDNKAFPRGFGKSGHFTLIEDDILQTYGQTLSALELGTLNPINSEEKRFIKVIKNPGKAKTKIEQTWLKYMKFSRERKVFYSLNAGRRHPSPRESTLEVGLEF